MWLLMNRITSAMDRKLTSKDDEEKENRYLKLLNKVIRQGVKTKVLMLSATPVNNRFLDLKTNWHWLMKVILIILTINLTPLIPLMIYLNLPKEHSIRGVNLSMTEQLKTFLKMLDLISLRY